MKRCLRAPLFVPLLGVLASCGEPGREAQTPTLPAASPRPAAVLGYAASEVPGTFRVFDVDDATGVLTPRSQVTPSGPATAPVVRPGTFTIHPSGRFFFYSYDSCSQGWCGDLASYEIGEGGALTLLQHVGPAILEGGMEALFSTSYRLLVHCDDAPWHSFETFSVDSAGRLTAAGWLSFSYGYASVPRPFRLSPRNDWGYGLTSKGLMEYRLDVRGSGLETLTHTLPGRGMGLEMNATGTRLYLALATTPPRIDVYAIDDRGLGEVVSRLAVPEAGFLQVDPLGRFLYLSTATGVTAFAIDRRAEALTASGTAGLSDVQGMSFLPSGRFLYVSHADGTLQGLSVDPATGALKEVGGRVPGSKIQFAERSER